MTMPGFFAGATLTMTTNQPQRRGALLPSERAVYPAQVTTIPGDSLSPLSWYAVHPPKFGVVHPGQTDDFIACVHECVAETGDYAACQRGCCKQFTHYSACVIP